METFALVFYTSWPNVMFVKLITIFVHKAFDYSILCLVLGFFLYKFVIFFGQTEVRCGRPRVTVHISSVQSHTPVLLPGAIRYYNFCARDWKTILVPRHRRKFLLFLDIVQVDVSIPLLPRIIFKENFVFSNLDWHQDKVVTAKRTRTLTNKTTVYSGITVWETAIHELFLMYIPVLSDLVITRKNGGHRLKFFRSLANICGL